MSLLRPRGRHAKPSKAAPVLAAGGLTASLGVLDAGALAGPAHAVGAHAAYALGTDADFARLRGCESGGRYGTNTGNGYYGAYQFDLGTWHSLGYGGNPAAAGPSTQDAAAHQLQADRGWQPWPACSRALGLGSRPASLSLSRSPQPPVRASRTRGAIPGRSTVAPDFGGHVLTVQDVGHGRADVATWQQRMLARGWDIVVDGYYGAESARVAGRFAAEKRLSTSHGTVDRVLWDAAWHLPVS